MAGAYCKFCGNRCFVYRVLPNHSWAGHMATCPDGMQLDRERLGHDHSTAVNPAARNVPAVYQAIAEAVVMDWEARRGKS